MDSGRYLLNSYEYMYIVLHFSQVPSSENLPWHEVSVTRVAPGACGAVLAVFPLYSAGG